MQGTLIDLNKALDSKIYMNEKSNISFASPRAYIEPFLEKFEKAGLHGVKYEVAVSERVANKESESQIINEAYGRIAIKAILPVEFTACAHNSTIGMIYALDTVKPTIRIYSGEEAWACTNLAIFGAKYIHEVGILSGYNSIYEKGSEFIDGTMEQLGKFQQIYERMNDMIYTNEEIDRVVGHLLREANKNKAIGTTPVLSAVKDMDDPKSIYAIKEGKISQWKVYSALTQYCTDKVDIFERSVKTQLLSNLFVTNIN